MTKIIRVIKRCTHYKEGCCSKGLIVIDETQDHSHQFCRDLEE